MAEEQTHLSVQEACACKTSRMENPDCEVHGGDDVSACGEVRPGNYANWVPVCDRPPGHEGDHECPSPPGALLLRRYWWSRDGLQQGMSASTREATGV